jgi:hypothetical protein
MSEFLTNLAARSRGILETIRPRVPSRFEPIRRVDGLLAGRTASGEERLEDNPEEVGGAGDVAASAATDPTEKRPPGSRPTGPRDLSPRFANPSPAPAQFVPEPMATRAAPGANSPMNVPTPRDPVLQAKRIPGSETASFSAPDIRALRTVADTVTPSRQNPVHRSGVEPTASGTVQPVETAVTQRRETDEGSMQSRGVQQVRPAQSLRLSGRNAPDGGLIVSPTIRNPARPEQMRARSARAASIASSGSEIEPRMRSSRAKDTWPDDQVAVVQSPPARATPMTVEPARAEGAFKGSFRLESGRPEIEGAPDRPGPADALTLKPQPIPDLAIRPAPRQEMATLASGAELAEATTRPAAPKSPPQTFAGTASEPAIRVTIGRVEVRAVFPEQPVKRSAPPRFRPSVTLDEYLNRGSGAKR